MADKRPNTRQEAYDALVKQLNSAKDRLNAAIKSGEVPNDSRAIINSKYAKEIDRIQAQIRSTGPIGELGAGMTSAAVGLFTGIPDLGIAGYNLYNEKRAPTMSELVTGKPAPIKPLRERVMEFAGMAPEATSEEGSMLQAAPDIAVGAYGVAQLGKLGYTGLKNWLDSRKTKELLSKLSPEEGNIFRDIMLRGQGGSNTEIAAQIAKLERDPKYAELLAAFKREAANRSVQGVAPAASRITEEQAAVGSAQAVQNRLSGLSDARKVAGDQAFSKAFGYGEGKPLVDTTQTINQIDSLIARYSSKTTPNADRAVEVLQSIRDRLSPSFTVEGRAGTPVSTTRTVTGMDAAGMPTTSQVPTSFTIPGSSPYTVNQGPQKLTVEQVQGILSEFGKKASQGDSLIKDLALSDEKIISSAVFGGMKDDLAAAFKQASGSDRTALGMLIRARKEVSDASTAYTDTVAQGIPAWLKNKSLSEINFEELYSQYKATTPTQRAVFRSYVQNTEPEALKNLDSRVWSEFTTKYQGQLPDGLPGIDLAKMAQDWTKMSAVEKDAVATALGQNLDTFSERMKDALIFTRKLKVGAGEDVASKFTRDAAAVVGSTPLGYQGSKITQLLGDTITAFRSGVVSNDLAFKTLLTNEGASFLKSASLSPGSRKTLQELTKVTESQGILPTVAQIGTAVAPNVAAQPEPEFVIPDEFKIPAEEVSPQQSTTAPEEGGFVIPEEFQTQAAPVASAPAPTPSSAPKSRTEMSRDILQTEYNSVASNLSKATDPTQQARLQRDLEALQRELRRLK